MGGAHKLVLDRMNEIEAKRLKSQTQFKSEKDQDFHNLLGLKLGSRHHKKKPLSLNSDASLSSELQQSDLNDLYGNEDSVADQLMHRQRSNK